MTTDEAIEYFGGRKRLAQVLNIYPQATYHWGDYPPRGTQYELYVKSQGQLKVEEVYVHEGQH